MATNAKQGKQHTQRISQDREFVIVRFALLFTLPKRDFHQEAEDIHDRSFNVLFQAQVQ